MYIGSYNGAVLYRVPINSRAYDSGKSVGFGNSVVLKRQGSANAASWYEVDYYGTTYYILQSKFTSDTMTSEGKTFVRLLDTNTWYQKDKCYDYFKANEKFTNTCNIYFNMLPIKIEVAYLSTDKGWGYVSNKKKYFIMSNFTSVSKKTYSTVNASNTFVEDKIKNVKINEVDVVFTRTENGDININNLNMEDLDSEKYKVDVTYEE